MKLTALTCTFGRPEAMALCRKYLERQTRPPDQWLILDDDRPMPAKVLSALEGGRVEGDALVFLEDDDYFRPGWLAWCDQQLGRYDMAGQGNAMYYQVGKRWWSECRNVRHASLCQTAITAALFEPLCNIIRSFANPFFDTRLWQIECAKYLHLPKTDEERLVIGIKGMPGLLGYSAEHAQSNPPGAHSDPSLLKLWKMIGQDASAYAKYRRP